MKAINWPAMIVLILLSCYPIHNFANPQTRLALNALNNATEAEKNRMRMALGLGSRPLPQPIVGGSSIPGESSESLTADQDGLLQDQLEMNQPMRFDAGQLEELLRERERERESEGILSRFGSDIFGRKQGMATGLSGLAIPEGYRLGPGDRLDVMVTGAGGFETSLFLGLDGAVMFPDLGKVVLNGLSLEAARRLLREKIREKIIGSDVFVSLGPLRRINIFVSGEVEKPGAYSTSALTKISQALYTAGGINDIGSYREIAVRRAGETVRIFDTYDLLLKGDNKNDITLQEGDVVFVPVARSLAHLFGAVRRPAIYDFKKNEDLGALIDMAGGLLPRSNKDLVILDRYEFGDSLPQLINIDLNVESSRAMALKSGDKITVRSIPEESINPITVSGAAAFTGPVGWRPGLRIADLFSDLEGDLSPEADRELSLLIRRKNIRKDIEVIAVSLTKANEDKESPDNIFLSPHDRIIILPTPKDAAMEEAYASADSEAEDEEKLMEERLGSIESFDFSTSVEEEFKEEEKTRRELIDPIITELRLQSGSGSAAKIVRLNGEVTLPGDYPLIAGGSISSMIQLAGGFKDGAYLPSAEIRRVTINNDGTADVRLLQVDLTGLNTDRENLLPKDTIQINSIPNYSVDRTITVDGEFMFPGEYTISQGEKMSSIINRAGGFTREAFLRGVRYFSASAREAQSQQLQKIAASISRQMGTRSAVSLAEQSGMNRVAEDDLKGEEGLVDEDLLGRVVVDIPSLLAGDLDADFVVESGDTITAPKFSDTIGLVGEVYEPGTFKFEAGTGISGYLKLAGGVTTYGSRKNTYVLKADGSVTFTRPSLLGRLNAFSFEENQIEAGDLIVVPPNLDYQTPLSRISSISSVLFESFTSLAGILALTR